MEDEKFHNLLSVSWKPRKAGGVTQFESKGLGTREVNSIVRAGEDEMRYPSSLVREEKKNKFLLPPPFLLFRFSMDCMMPTYSGEGKLLNPHIQM